jgi:protein involved in polysaccharide export with SLBB domain
MAGDPRPPRGRARRGRRAAFALGLVAATLLAAACEAPPLVEGNVPRSTLSSDFDWDAYALGAGDVVSVVVFGHPELSTPERGERVDLQGSLQLPLVGGVPVADLTTEEARLAVRDRLAEFVVDPSVTLSVVEYGSRRVYVLGQVQAPGEQVLDRPITALQALSRAGGFAAGADREIVALMRSRGAELEVHYFNAATPGVDGLVAVEPGDMIFVRQSGAGKFSEQVLPYLQGSAPVIGTFTNLFLIAEAFGDD